MAPHLLLDADLLWYENYLTDKPATAVPILKHVWDKEYKNPHKQKLMNKYWKRNVNLAELMLEIGKHKGHKDDVKLLQCVNKFVMI